MNCWLLVLVIAGICQSSDAIVAWGADFLGVGRPAAVFC